MDRTTVNVYEAHVDDWIEHRRRARPSSIDAFAARVPPGVRADVGCGPGWHSADLGTPVASIGGAGTFDGVFLTGIVAVLLAGWPRGYKAAVYEDSELPRRVHPREF